MAQNIQMNVKQEDGSYEVVYPQTISQNITDLQDNYYNKEQILQSNVAQLIGLTGQANPNDMFNILAHAGDLHVWKRTQSGAIDYPISVNKNAYQEGSDEQPARYVLGELQSGTYQITISISPNDIVSWTYGTEIAVSNSGDITITGATNTIGIYGNSGLVSSAQSLIGKYVKPDKSVGVFNANSVYFFPSDASVAFSNSAINTSKYQTVTGYPAIPVNTTIEYMGQIGDKVQIEVGSYTGTGTYGQNNPTTIDFGLSPKIVIIYNTNMLPCAVGRSGSPIPFVLNFNDLSTSYIQITNSYTGHEYIYAYMRKNVNTQLQIYAVTTGTSSDISSAQLNVRGRTYTYIYLY